MGKPLLSATVGKKGSRPSRTLKVHLEVLTKQEVLDLLAEFTDEEQGFFVHRVEGSMVSLTISPTRGGND